jgi:hypothetical protein
VKPPTVIDDPALSAGALAGIFVCVGTGAELVVTAFIK